MQCTFTDSESFEHIYITLWQKSFLADPCVDRLRDFNVLLKDIVMSGTCNIYQLDHHSFLIYKECDW